MKCTKYNRCACNHHFLLNDHGFFSYCKLFSFENQLSSKPFLDERAKKI